MHKKMRIRTLTVLLALIMSFIPVTVTNAAITEEEPKGEETVDQEITTIKAKASAKFKNKNLSFKKSKSKTAVLITKNLKIEKIDTTVKNDKATVKSIVMIKNGTTTTIKVKLVGKVVGKDKLTVTLTTDTGRKVKRNCNINITAPATKKETPKKQDTKERYTKKPGDIGGNKEQQEAAEDFLEWLEEDPEVNLDW